MAGERRQLLPRGPAATRGLGGGGADQWRGAVAAWTVNEARPGGEARMGVKGRRQRGSVVARTDIEWPRLETL